MARRSGPGTILTLILGLVILGIVALACSTILIAKVGLFLAGAVLAETLQGLAGYLYLMTVLEIATAAVVWATQGPIPAWAWVTSRVAAWQGQ